ncbi:MULTISPECIES: SDR family NAD(P)-dependent oxidoreductase [Streptomyces]|uniref:SDR family NAD(P)-dependent oxidoreductase n=1 Tax=Streptomyces TaxID=1883 RepID=UPI00093EBE94|nr:MULTISPECIES: SDR family NAD(P)-dependent oxidoreductase [unclassified Streptomyces]OKJ01249.1 short-chain dehydrogenase [Streptomyces sp. TSRI0261]QNQ35674.1 SDR family oxidoreductase [Streptomyces sp. CB00271]
MELALQGKKLLITGGTRGIGRGIVLAAARAGADVLTCHRQDGEAVDSLAEELKRAGGEHHVIRCDVGEISEVDRLAGEARDRFGRLDGVVNNAGVISHIPFAELPAEEWSRIIDTNLTASYRIIQQTLPLLGAGASVVNIGSRGAAAGIPLRAHYTAAKSALTGLTRSLAKELGPRGIRINVVAPGVIETEAFDAMPAERAAGLRDTYARKTALARLGTVDELAGPVLFLLSDFSGYITGETLNVDGGI